MINNMQYKLINQKTKEKHLCDKVTIGEFDYYISSSDISIKEGEACYSYYTSELTMFGLPHRIRCKKVIATNKFKNNIPKVINVEKQRTIVIYYE